MIDTESPEVTIVIPCRNEARDIEACLRSILSQEGLPEGRKVEVLVVDGMSEDETRQRIREIAAADPRVRLIDNPGRIAATGLNLAIQAAKGGIVIRIDAHSEYAPDYVRQCVAALKETEADNVGGPALTRALGFMQRAIAAAYHCPFSAGGARFHDPSYEGELDTVLYGCWRKETLVKVGLFDEELVRNQDDELNYRIVRAGGRLWQTPRIRSWYRPRMSLRELFQQYLQYGYWRVRVVQKHGRPASARHLVPVVFVLGVCFGWLAGLVHPALGVAYCALIATYGLINVAFSIWVAFAYGWDLLPVLPVVFFTYHFSYGGGFLLGLLDFVILRRGARPTMKLLTRNDRNFGPGSGGDERTQIWDGVTVK